jgi:glycosyltransferase involved in cell wall biosynthesis
MNVLIITAMFPPIRTGTSFYSKNLGQALLAAGHSVSVLTLVNRDKQEETYPFPVRRIRALHFPVKNYFKHFRLCSIFPRNYADAIAAAGECRADVILLVNHYLDIAFIAVVVSLLRRIPLVCSVGTQLQSANPRRDRILNVLERLICGRLLFPFCRRLIAWDTQIQKYLSDVHGLSIVKKTVIVNYGVDGDMERFLAHRQEYSLHHQVLGVGAVSEQRDFLPLVRAFALVADEFPALNVKIIGHVYYDAAPRLARSLGLENRIRFTGELSHETALSEMKKSDVLFSSLTARYVGLGIATAEAMLTGLATIANVPAGLLGNDAMLADMQDFVSFDGTSEEKLAMNIKRLVTDQALRERIGQSGKRFVLKYMNWDVVAKQMERALEPLIKKQSAAG